MNTQVVHMYLALFLLEDVRTELPLATWLSTDRQTDRETDRHTHTLDGEHG